MKTGSRQISSSRLLRGFLNIDHGSEATAKLPLYLCPAAARASSTLSARSKTSSAAAAAALVKHGFLPLRPARRLNTEAAQAQNEAGAPVGTTPVRHLPIQCFGCGALSQTAAPDQPGYYNLDRKAIKLYLGLVKEQPRTRAEEEIIQASLRSLGPEKMRELGLNPDALATEEEPVEHDAEQDLPLCERCHNLVHHHTGEPIYHPTLDAIRDTIEESPYKYNHVYHVLDAADFPMSLMPKIHELLDIMPLRTKNRRSRSGKYYRGKKTEMSFIITRSDLLAPKKEQVDRLMPYLIETLRQALPRESRHVRLGNVRCVSAKRSWWTKELKEDIWKRGGAGWMVGRVNVGKSQLFQAVFPKGRMDLEGSKHDISVNVQPRGHGDLGTERESAGVFSGLDGADGLDEGSLLPPPRPETNYPKMPVVSALAGTTASPIRVPFGGGKGELIDLPGLERSNLDYFVKEEHRPSLIMKARMSPEQCVVKPGQSLLIGGFIRITPRTPDLIFLAYAFTPIKGHLTATEKAVDIQNHKGQVNVENIALPETAEKIKHAGAFPVRWDVTKRRAGPITRKDAAGISVDRLPYRVLSMDIVIEGCGWVEITVQVRTRHLMNYAEQKPKSVNAFGEEILQELDLSEPGSENEQGRGHQWEETDGSEPAWPVVDVYSPEGRFIACRPPMNAWLYNKVRKTAQTSKKRPRKSMVGAKKREKEAKRSRRG